jgi:DNA polymerase-1
MAMIKVGDPEKGRMLLQVHDELIFEVAESHVDADCNEIGAKMEQVAELKVPLRVNTGAGVNWEEAHS